MSTKFQAKGQDKETLETGGKDSQLYKTLDDWISRETIPLTLDSPEALNAVADKVIKSMDASVELLGFGEALHGGEDILILRNRFFQRLAEAHGYSAIAIESGFPQAQIINQYINGKGPASYEEVQDTGFSHGFGRLAANRELVEWMRYYNAEPSHAVKLRFYGIDMPLLAAGGHAGPGKVLPFVLDYLASIDEVSAQEYRDRIEPLLEQNANWENALAWRDPLKSPEMLAVTNALRIETENLITELRIRSPELIAQSDENLYLEALQNASVARQLLNYLAALAQTPNERLVETLFGIRDALIAENIAYIVSRERGRGKVLAFAHNTHLQLGKIQVKIGPNLYTSWPAGAHLKDMFGSRYAVIGSAIGESPANGIGQPEPGTLEARLTAMPGPIRFVPTHRGQGLPGSEIAALPVRSGSTKNPTYMIPLNPQAFTDFDCWVVLDSTPYYRGGMSLPE